MNKKLKQKIKDYIEQTWWEISVICQGMFMYYTVVYSDSEVNPHNGDVSVNYSPSQFRTLVVYKNMFKQMEEFTKDDKDYIKLQLCHEAGHLYIGETGWACEKEEQIATRIGNLILKVLENENTNNTR